MYVFNHNNVNVYLFFFNYQLCIFMGFFLSQYIVRFKPKNYLRIRLFEK